MVYHYCSVETFLNIIRNHTLRLSDLCSSTDRLEMKALVDLIKEKAEELYREQGVFSNSIIHGMTSEEAFSYLLEVETDKIKNDTDQLLYGICFSENGDLLGQWREYADKGKGFAIGFEKKWFQNICELDKGFKFGKVSYIHDDKATQIINDGAENLLTGICEVMKRSEMNTALRTANTGSLYIELGKRVMYMESTFIKRIEYADEKEWRLIIDDEQTNKRYDDWIEYYNWSEEAITEHSGLIQKLMPKGLQFSVRNDKIVSYIDMKYDLDPDNMPIKEIVMGPNCKVSESDVFQLLEFYGFDGSKIEIAKSKSSYC